MNKKTTLSVVIVVVILIIIGLSVKGSNKESGTQPIIAAAIPLSGNYASIGENIKRGLDLAREDYEKAHPGSPIKLMYEDACLPKDITSAVQKLITIDKVKVINQFCAVGIVPSFEITEAHKIINVEVAANVDDLLGKQYFFSPNFAVRDNAKTIADFAVDTLKAKKVAFIYYNTQFGKDYRKYIGAQVTARGGEIVGDEMTSLDVTDFKTNLLKIKSAKPDVIFVTQLTGALGTIIKQSKDLGIAAPLIGNYQNEDPIVLNVAGAAAEGFIISSADPALLSKDTSGFRDRYLAKYGIAPDVFASNAYDALMLEIPAYISCGGDTDCMRTALHAISNYQGVSGTITIDENGVASKPTIFKIVKEGKFVEFK